MDKIPAAGIRVIMDVPGLLVPIWLQSEQRHAQEEIGFAQVLRRLSGIVRRRSWGARRSSSRRRAQSRTTYQTIFSDIPRPHIDPCRLTALKIRPSVRVADVIHVSLCQRKSCAVLRDDVDTWICAMLFLNSHLLGRRGTSSAVVYCEEVATPRTVSLLKYPVR